MKRIDRDRNDDKNQNVSMHRDRNGSDNQVDGKKGRNCRFLACASICTHTQSVVVLATNSTTKDGNPAISDSKEQGLIGTKKYDGGQACLDEFGRRVIPSTDKETHLQKQPKASISDKEEEVTTTKKSKKRKRIKFRGTPVKTRSMLPLNDSSLGLNQSMFLMSPQDALSHGDNSIHKEIYVKPLVILDLNGILCHRIRDRDIPEFILNIVRPEIDMGEGASISSIGNGQDANWKRRIRKTIYRQSCGNVAGTPIIQRTDLNSFLTFLDQHFTLAVWTSAKKRTADSLVDLLFPRDIARRLLFVWSQNHCGNEKAKQSNESTTTGQGSLVHRKSHYRDIVFIKSLGKVWAAYPLWNETNTLLIDDSPEKCPEKMKHNTLHPPPILGLDSSVLSDSQTKDVASVYCDDSNQKLQLDFFEKLSTVWTSSEDDGDPLKDPLKDFLGKGEHRHMGWRGDI
jgi:hypothetical protein